MTEQLTVAIDGPASSGKSTVAKQIAKKLNLIYIDTGAMYRSVTLYIMQAGIDVKDEDSVAKELDNISITFQTENDQQRVILNDIDVTEAIRSIEVTNNVSLISSYRAVREALVNQQRELAHSTAVIMDGRDIGTVVLPDASVKIFLKASPEERAKRRTKEYKQKGIIKEYHQILEDIKQRDKFDSTREISPLRQATDAVVIDSTALNIQEVVKEIIKLTKKN